MKSMFKLTLAASVALVMTTGCSQSDGSSNSQITPPPPISASGKLIDGYLAGAQVFADCNNNKTFEIAKEPSTITDALGDFSLTIPASCANATLIASGGTSVDTGLPFSGVLMAPAGSENITPLTTLVTVDPTFEAKIAAYGIAIDTDFVGTAIPSDLLIISQQVATAINITAFNTKVSDTSALIASIVEPLAASLQAVDFNDSNASASTLSVAAKDAFQVIAEENPDMEVTGASDIKDSINATLDVITTEVNSAPTDANGSVILSDVDTAAITTAVEDNNADIEAAVTIPVVHIDGFRINGGADINSSNNLFVTTTTESDIKTTLTAVVDVTDAADRNYSVELSMAVADVNSARSANVVIANIVMTTMAGQNTLTIDPAQVLSATITGTDSNGDLFTAVQLTGGTLGDIFTSNGTELELNMGALLNKVQTTAGTNHPLGDFFIPGQYGVTVVANGGIPMEFLNYTLDLTITQ